MLCNFQLVVCIWFWPVWCPALPGCHFPHNGRSEEGLRARYSAGANRHWCAYISELLLFYHNYNISISENFAIVSTHIGDNRVTALLFSKFLACIYYSLSPSYTLLLLFGCCYLYSSVMFFNKSVFSKCSFRFAWILWDLEMLNKILTCNAL